MERAQQIQIVAERFHPFHRDEKPDFFGIERTQNVLMRPTNDTSARFLGFSVKPGDLIERDL